MLYNFKHYQTLSKILTSENESVIIDPENERSSQSILISAGLLAALMLLIIGFCFICDIVSKELYKLENPGLRVNLRDFNDVDEHLEAQELMEDQEHILPQISRYFRSMPNNYNTFTV